jgi:hypothetical protein
MDAVSKMRLGEVSLALVAGVALLHEAAYRACLSPLGTPESACPPWLVALSSFGGAGLAVGSRTTGVTSRNSTVSSYVTFALVALLLLTRPPLFVTAVAGGVITHGTVGIVTGRIAVSGKGGPSRSYGGLSAIALGAAFVLFGFAALVVEVGQSVLPNWFTHPIFEPSVGGLRWLTCR